MASQPARSTATANGEPASEDALPIGPPSGLSAIPTQHIAEQSLRHMLKSINYDEAREDNYRLKGVHLVDNVRESLQLPVKTFCSAAVYYHKFRIRFPSSEYNYEDVALASLFTACKVEDTIKKSKEILCAAHNLRYPNDHKSPDDKAFESPSRFTVGLERHILETIGFDFRVHHPQPLLIKMIRKMGVGKQDKFFEAAYDMSIDIYKTFAPIKQTTPTLVMAVLELTARLMEQHQDKVREMRHFISRINLASIHETMLDLLDLYTQFPKPTKVVPRWDIDKLMDVKIDINKRMSAERHQRYYDWCERCEKEAPEAHPVTPGSAISPATNTSVSVSGSVKRKSGANEGTLRFVFDAEKARMEKKMVAEYFEDQYEEYEKEVEEPVPETRPRPPPTNPSRSNFPHRGHSHGDHSWGPYARGRHSDRSKGRKGHY